MAKILYVEDDVQLAERVTQWLELVDKHLVEHVENGTDAIERLDAFKYELVILDVNLPDMTGIEILRDFRRKGGQTSVLLLTGRDSVDEKIQGLDSGADDYLTKPFDIKELGARLRTLLRRPAEFTSEVIKIDNVEIDSGSRSVKVGETDVQLKPREFLLLEFLMRHQNKVISPDDILNHVWRSESDATSETIYTHVKNVRKKLAAAGADDLIRTVHGAGYIVGADKT